MKPKLTVGGGKSLRSHSFNQFVQTAVWFNNEANEESFKRKLFVQNADSVTNHH